MALAQTVEDDSLPPTLVIEHLEGLSFDETITPSLHERRSGVGEKARVQALPQIVDDASGEEAEFTTLEAIAVGGIGVVQLAHQRSIDRDVAIKRVRDPSVPGAAAMLLEEGRVMGLLEHPSVIPVLALGRDGNGQAVLVMKRVEGNTWRAMLRDAEHPAWKHTPGDRLEFHLRVLAQVADVVHYAHLRGWLHRDIKPSNVMVGLHNEVYLIDWGLAVHLPAEASPDAPGLVGTPAYMAPEMLEGLGPWLSPQTDVYLLGASLHEVLTGKAPHDGDNLRAVLSAAWLSVPYEYPDSTPEELAALARDATSAQPGMRPSSAEVFKQRIEAYLSHRAALAVIEEGRTRFRLLCSMAHEGSVADEVDLLQHLDACLALLARGLELWPGNPAALESLTEALTWRIRRSLAQGDVLAAQTAFADLPRVDPSLEGELSRAAARIGLERVSQARLTDLGRKHDRRPLAPRRARAARLSAVLGGGAMLGLGVAVRGGLVPFVWNVLALAAAAGLGVVVVGALRGVAYDGVVDRAGLREMSWITGGALAITLLGHVIGLSPGQSLALLPVLAAVSAGLLAEGLGAARWRLVAVCAVSAALAPAVLWWNATFLLDLIGLTTILVHLLLARTWERLAGEPVGAAIERPL